jgi:hypothetical protein
MHLTTQKLVVLAVLGVGAFGVASFTRRDAPAGVEQADVSVTAKNPRLLIRRFWFDRLPKKRGDEIDVWLFLGGGIGFEEKGSTYRFGLDVFEFERQGSKVDLVWLHDKKKQNVPFDVVECHDKPPFDLCLDLKEPLREQRRLWSFDDDAEMDANIPWAREWMASAEARARTVR